MANNQYVNKVEFGNRVVMDISDTTASASDVLSGKKLYTASGAPATGTLVPGTITEVQANGTSVATSGIANIPAASTSGYGVTKLNNTTSSTSTSEAATAAVVKQLNDKIGNVSSTDLQSQVDSLNRKTDTHSFGSLSSLSAFVTELNSFVSTLGQYEFRNIVVEFSATASPFVAGRYIGTVSRTTSARAQVTLQMHNGQQIIHGIQNEAAWAWDKLVLNSELMDREVCPVTYTQNQYVRSNDISISVTRVGKMYAIDGNLWLNATISGDDMIEIGRISNYNVAKTIRVQIPNASSTLLLMISDTGVVSIGRTTSSVSSGWYRFWAVGVKWD